VLSQIIIDAMGASVEFASMPGQDLGRKKAALAALGRMNEYVGPKGEFGTNSSPAGYDKKVRQAREGKLKLAEEVSALEAQQATLRGSPTAGSGNATALPPTVNGLFGSEEGVERPAYDSGGVADWFVEQSYQVNGLGKDDSARKILDASWKMKTEERFAVLSDLCERMNKDPSIVPEDQPELKIDILLSAAEAGKIVADMPKVFKKDGIVSDTAVKGGGIEILFIAKEYVERAGKPGQNKRVWTPERIEKRKKLAQEIENQIDHRGRQMKKAILEDSQ
jgi:hypothetical protein